MTYEEFKLIKQIKKHAGREESFYLNKFNSLNVFEKAQNKGYVSYEQTGLEEIKSSAVIGFLPTYSKVWIITNDGNKAFDEYAEERRELWSGRKFSIFMALLGAVASLIISVVVNVLFH